MRKHNYIIGTGYHARHDNGDALSWFYRIWEANTFKYADPFAVYVIATGDGRIPDQIRPEVYWVPILGDLGYIGDLLHGAKPYALSGYTVALFTLALLAYQNECDLVFKEQDALAFGPYIDTMYSEIGTHGCIFGKARSWSCAQSVMLILHSFLPEFVRLHLGTGPENVVANIGEEKMKRLEQQNPGSFCRFTFGVDRERPFDVKSPVWYGQKFTGAEMLDLRNAGLIEFNGDPPGGSSFTNCPNP